MTSYDDRLEKALADVEIEVGKLQDSTSAYEQLKKLVEVLGGQKEGFEDTQRRLIDKVTAIENLSATLEKGKSELQAVAAGINESLETLVSDIKKEVTDANVEHQKKLSEDIDAQLENQKRDITDAHRGEVAHVTDKLTVALEKVSLSLSAEINSKFNTVGKKVRLLIIIQMLTVALLCGGFFYVLEKLTS
tara:strand:- start:1161 stop:1733 length:573 start_codon:yes stop_codon:yes gene_type:complete